MNKFTTPGTGEKMTNVSAGDLAYITNETEITKN